MPRKGRVRPQAYAPAATTSAAATACASCAAIEQVRLLCTVYDPAAGRYRLNYAVLTDLIVGTSVMLGGLGFVGFEWRRRRRSGLTQVKPRKRVLS